MPSRITRRSFLKQTIVTTVALGPGLRGLAPTAAVAGEMAGHGPGVIDTNVYFSRWPFRRLPLDETSALRAKLRSHDVGTSWVGSFDALLHQDITSVNARLVEECASDTTHLKPCGAINPMLPGWEEDLRRCHEVHRMHAIRLHPNYHGYALDHPVCLSLFEQATARGLVIQIPLLMEDERTQHRLVQVPHVSAEPLPEILNRLPQARILLLNAFRPLRPSRSLFLRLANLRQVTFDIASVESLPPLVHGKWEISWRGSIRATPAPARR